MMKEGLFFFQLSHSNFSFPRGELSFSSPSLHLDFDIHIPDRWLKQAPVLFDKATDALNLVGLLCSTRGE